MCRRGEHRCDSASACAPRHGDVHHSSWLLAGCTRCLSRHSLRRLHRASSRARQRRAQKLLGAPAVGCSSAAATAPARVARTWRARDMPCCLCTFRHRCERRRAWRWVNDVGKIDRLIDRSRHCMHAGTALLGRSRTQTAVQVVACVRLRVLAYSVHRLYSCAQCLR
jgi:hypothetical protein